MQTHSLLMQDLTAQSQALANGVCTSVALTTALLAHIHRHQPQLNAFLHLDAAGALQAAAASDRRRVSGQSLGVLDGLSLAVKDNIDVAGMPTTAGMASRRSRVAAQDAVVVQRLRAAGMLLLGKLNMHEAALGATNHNPHFGRCENPLRAGFTPGGSSGGSACAVAAGLCALALGTDTMGSVRLPAAYCGVVGFKASYGVVSTRGTVACSYGLDHVGPLLRSRRDLNLVLPEMLAFDAACADARQLLHHRSALWPSWVAAANVEALGATPEVSHAYQRALAALRARGDTVTEISLADYDFGRARRAGLLVVEADLLIEHATDWHDQPANFSPELAKMLRYAEKQSASHYAAALRVMQAAHVEVARWFAVGDVMLLPTAPQTAFAFDNAVPSNQADFTSIANMAGVPALTAPLPCAAGSLPAGLQCIAPLGHERMLMALDLDGICTS
jgi:Asp-tRNA(Asn)/Glu-tRNA(Gln) amidotransferase A subunit family amidase